MPVVIYKIGEDQQAISVEVQRTGIRQEIRDARTVREAVGIVERRIPTGFPTIEIPRAAAIDGVNQSTNLTPAQKADAIALLESLGEFDRIVFDGPYPLSAGAGQLDQGGAAKDGQPPKPPLVIVFLDP